MPAPPPCSVLGATENVLLVRRLAAPCFCLLSRRVVHGFERRFARWQLQIVLVADLDRQARAQLGSSSPDGQFVPDLLQFHIYQLSGIVEHDAHTHPPHLACFPPQS